MIILINKKKAVLKKGTSFDFISENRFFTGADSYTLSITFPIKGCSQNIEIFGHIYRKDFDFNTELLDCEIHDRHFHKYGSISIVSVSETEVKTQFLEGRSATNFHSALDEMYINEMEMPSLHDFAHYGLAYYMRSYNEQKEEQQQGKEYLGWVVLPWVNNTSGNIQNRLYATNSGYFLTDAAGGNDEASVVGFPFFVEIIRQVLTKAGYDCDLSEIENSQWCNLIICQGFPIVWDMPYMNQILPHWTVSEFLEQVELFLNGTFEPDGTNRMKFTFNINAIDQLQVVSITSVVDSHSVDIAEKDNVRDDYMEQKNVAYKECNHQMWKFYSCEWAKVNLPICSYASIAAMRANLDSYLNCAGNYKTWHYRCLHYCENEDTFFVLKCIRTQKIDNVIHHYMRYQPVNVFGPKMVNLNENAEVVELGIVPACIDHADRTRGDMVFVECGTLGDDETDAEDKDENQTQAVNALALGETNQKEEFFDKIHVAFWDENKDKYHPLMPHPYIDKHEFTQDNTYYNNNYSMRLEGSLIPFSRRAKYQVEQRRKFTFSFLSDSIPDVRSIFLIHGKKYLAEKITATFSAETGMSQLLKMVCYRLKG